MNRKFVGFSFAMVLTVALALFVIGIGAVYAQDPLPPQDPPISGILCPGGIIVFQLPCPPPPPPPVTTLSATKTATGHWTYTFHWTIDKSVTPDTWDLFTGDSGTSKYTISVTKDAGTETVFVDGEICVENTGSNQTTGLTIWDDVYYKVGDGQFIKLASAQVSTSINPVLNPDESECYPYSITFNPVEDAQYRNSARITITNYEGHAGTAFGPSPNADFSLPDNPTGENNTITVTDNGESWEFYDDGSVSYEKIFTCDDEGTNVNTATIDETGQSDDSSVTVNCYALEVSKDANTSFKRTYSWTIDKYADQSSLTLSTGQQFPVNYSVKVNVTGYTDSDLAVSGNISVHNPAPMAATLNSVSDVVSGVGAASVNCGVSFPYSLAADGDLNCTYSASLPNASSRTNTATATLQNTPSGTTDFSGSASVDFGAATKTDVDKCISVSDTYVGSLGTVCTSDAPKTFTYSRNVGPYSVCGDFTVDNTASFTTNDTGASGSDGWTVNVKVPCPGCTLTIGYWKTHAGFGPQADMVSPLLPQYLGTQLLGMPLGKSVKADTPAKAAQYLGFYGSNNVFDASNGINKLYSQLLGAKLNIANGANGSAIASTITAADAFLAKKNSLDWNGLTKAQKNQVLAWVTALDNYNNGYIGPGYCSE